MPIPPIHAWQISIPEAIAIQKQLARQVTRCRPTYPIHTIAGIDAAFSKDGKTCIAAAILYDIAKKLVIEQQISHEPVLLPYIPGLLSFREAPAMLAALKQLSRKPDVLMVDGMGIAHPRRLGIAAHLGVLTQIPAIGCGKSRLVGTYCEPGENRGDQSPLMHQKERLGTVLRTKAKTKPLFISIGHKIDLETAEKLVLKCFNGYRLPEPTRLADRLVAEVKKHT